MRQTRMKIEGTPPFKSLPSDCFPVKNRKIPDTIVPDKTSLNFQLDPIFRALNFHIHGRALFASSCMLHARRRAQRGGGASYQACIRRVTHSTRRHKEKSYISTNVKNFQTPGGSDAMEHGSIPFEKLQRDVFSPLFARIVPAFPQAKLSYPRIETVANTSKSYVRRIKEKEREGERKKEEKEEFLEFFSIDRPSIPSRARFITRCHEPKKFFSLCLMIYIFFFVAFHHER